MLEDPVHFPGLAGIKRKVDGGQDTVMYLEGSDQHRGWFHSSLLESCGTRGRAPYDVVLTHGFTLDENGRKMSKSLGNTVEPQKVITHSGADILRLWVCATDYADDQRIGPEILKNTVETYRKLRNSIRWMLGTLHHFKRGRCGRAGRHARTGAADAASARRAEPRSCARPMRSSTTRPWSRASSAFMNTELSAFYFDIRKDTLYCDPPSSLARKAALTTIDMICDAILRWLAPVLSFTTEEAWRHVQAGRRAVGASDAVSGRTRNFRDEALAAKWETIRDVRRVVTGALELERAAKGSARRWKPRRWSTFRTGDLRHAVRRRPRRSLHHLECMVTQRRRAGGCVPLDDVRASPSWSRKPSGTKCARSWKILPTVGEDAEYPDVSPRDAQALREWKALGVTGLEQGR